MTVDDDVDDDGSEGDEDEGAIEKTPRGGKKRNRTEANPENVAKVNSHLKRMRRRRNNGSR